MLAVKWKKTSQFQTHGIRPPHTLTFGFEAGIWEGDFKVYYKLAYKKRDTWSDSFENTCHTYLLIIGHSNALIIQPTRWFLLV